MSGVERDAASLNLSTGESSEVAARRCLLSSDIRAPRKENQEERARGCSRLGGFGEGSSSLTIFSAFATKRVICDVMGLGSRPEDAGC